MARRTRDHYFPVLVNTQLFLHHLVVACILHYTGVCSQMPKLLQKCIPAPYLECHKIKSKIMPRNEMPSFNTKNNIDYKKISVEELTITKLRNRSQLAKNLI